VGRVRGRESGGGKGGRWMQCQSRQMVSQ
jgi:hypothetical protein